MKNIIFLLLMGSMLFAACGKDNDVARPLETMIYDVQIRIHYPPMTPWDIIAYDFNNMELIDRLTGEKIGPLQCHDTAVYNYIVKNAGTPEHPVVDGVARIEVEGYKPVTDPRTDTYYPGEIVNLKRKEIYYIYK